MLLRAPCHTVRKLKKSSSSWCKGRELGFMSTEMIDTVAALETSTVMAHSYRSVLSSYLSLILNVELDLLQCNENNTAIVKIAFHYFFGKVGRESLLLGSKASFLYCYVTI